MAEGGEGTTFENPAYDPDPWEDDDGDETTPFIIPDGTSTPVPGEKIEMRTTHEKEGLPEPSYIETSFGVQTSSERAWLAAKDLFPNMSSSELEVSYNTKGRLQVKMFGTGKKYYNLMTTEKGTGREQINKSLPKEIKTALGEPRGKQDAAARERYKKQMDEARDKIRIEQRNLESLKNSGAPEEDIYRVKAKIRSLETQHFLVRSKYENTAPDYEDEARIERETPVLEKIRTIDRQNETLNLCILSDIALSENSERRKEANERIERNKATFERNEKDKAEFLEQLGTKDTVLERQRSQLQQEKQQMDLLIQKDKQTIDDLDTLPSDRETAMRKMEVQERKSEWISERLNTTEQNLGIVDEDENERPLRERVKEIFKKYGVTVLSVFLAAGATIGAVIGMITNALKAMGKKLANGLKMLGAKAAAALPGLIGAIVSFLFKAAGSVIGFLAEHTWLLILAVVAFLFEKLLKRRN